MNLTVTILGCGNSAGTPAIGNYWGNCDPDEPRNRRTRPGIAVQSATTTLIVDTGPDFREQMNREDINDLDAVLYTHAHSDHITGIDELRVLRNRKKKKIDIYAAPDTMSEIRHRYDYMFVEKAAIYPSAVEPHIIAPETLGQPMTLGDIIFTPFAQDHGTCTSLGFRFGSLGYSTDVVRFDDKALKILKGIDCWIIDAAGYKMERNMVHLTLRQIYDYNKIIGAKMVYLTHLSPLMDYQTLRRELTDGFEPAYDGLRIELSA